MGTVPPKLVASDATYAIITSVQTVLPTSRIILDECHLNESILRHVGSFSRRRDFEYSGEEMKRDLHCLMYSSTVQFFNQTRSSFEKKYFLTSHVLARDSPFLVRVMSRRPSPIRRTEQSRILVSFWTRRRNPVRCM